MEGNQGAPRSRQPPDSAMAAVISDDDLLREILLRLGFPTCLVRAALVSKRWLRHASDPAFLRRFRARHPPHLLGFYAGHRYRSYEFVPLPQPPELAAPLRRAVSSRYDAFASKSPNLRDCRNGRLIVEFFHDRISSAVFSSLHALLTLLHAGKPVTLLPLTPLPGCDYETEDNDIEAGLHGMFLPEDGAGDGITFVELWKVGRKVSAEVYVLRSGGWGAPTTAAMELPEPGTDFYDMLPPVHGKVYMKTTSGDYILGLDLAASRFFVLELPDGLRSDFRLSRAEDSGLYLVSAKGFQLSVWLNTMGRGDGAGGGWVLVDTFCVREACKRCLADHSWVPENGGRVQVVAVGDNAEFVFLDHEASGVVVHVHLRSRIIEKVYQRTPDDSGLSGPVSISPFMMAWPPTFPALNGGHDQEE